MRSGAALVVAVGLAVSLAGCTSGSAEDSSCDVTAAGTSSDSISVSGDLGSKPEVTMDAPVTASSTERTVVTTGDGALANTGDKVTVEYSIFNGASGDVIDATSYDDASPAEWTLDETLIPGLTKTLICSTVGSRVVGVISPDDGLAEEALSQLGMTAEDSLVVVADIVDVSTPIAPLPKADGTDQPLPEDFPGIEVVIADDADGTPTVTLPDGDAPSELQIAVLKKGDGAEVESADSVVLNYQGVQWDNKEIFDQSWGTDGAAAAPATFQTTGLIPGFTQALEGQTVGSQVLVVIPPALAYGEASDENTAALAGKTLVFLIDILGIA